MPDSNALANGGVIGACPHDCSDNCSMIWESRDDALISVRGNPDHPYTRGGLCVKVAHFEERVMSEDRILYPLKRTGTKGSGAFERISWSDAISEIGSRWRGIIDKHGAEAILPYAYMGNAGTLNGPWSGDPFFNRLGASISEKTFCDSGAATAYLMTVGPCAGLDTESFAHSKYIILWACNTLSTSLHHWHFIAEAQKQGAKVVVIDPVRSRTAAKADWHLPIRPGTDGMLAMAMINVIISEGLCDDDFVARHTTGIDELTQRAAEYSPEVAAEATGIDAADIRQLAREYARSNPAAIRIGVAIERHTGGGQAVRAITCLPGLTGAWQQPGGGVYQLPVWVCPNRWENIHRPDLIKPGTRVLNQWKLADSLLGAAPEVAAPAPPIQSLFVYCANPVVVAPEQQRLVQGLMREDLFTVVHEQFMTDTARYADIILPAATAAEHSEVMVSWGSFYVNYNAAAIAPRGEAVSNTEMFRRLSAEMGFDDPFFQRSDDQIIEDSFDWTVPVFAEQGGLATLKSRGYLRYVADAPADHAPHRDGNFPTPSGKVEFVSAMAAGGNMVGPVFRQGSMEHQDGSPIDPLPHYVAPQETAADHPQAKDYPLMMISPKSHALINSQYANLPRQQKHIGEQQVQIHPDDAASRHIADGERVTVANQRGSFSGIAVVTDAVQPGLVAAPMGYWASANEGSSVAAVNSSRFADIGRAPTFSDTRVQVQRAE
jgi:anaerobic selenocysteine-containing dehydrogenase